MLGRVSVGRRRLSTFARSFPRRGRIRLLTVAVIVSLDATVALLLATRSLPAAIAAIAPAGLS
jgi:hypothetical protein